LGTPEQAVVPEHRAVQYLPTKDEKRSVGRPSKDAAALYRRVVAQASLLVVRSLLVSDPALDKVTFSGHVDTVDPASGEDAYPCLLSLVVDRDALPRDENLVRDGFDPEAAVTAMGALVSAHPYAQEPVEPFLDFDLTRFAFVDGLDAVSSLDARPNLLDISPSLFEHLVRQVLIQKGDEGWTTTESNDSGIDAVLVNRSTIMGGLTVVQAKRYRPGSKIGPSYIRELAGAMEEKKAGWGILVTTSSFTAGSEQKAREHGRMQLIRGDELCWLIKERTGKDVLIG
jgi:restriction system protein